MQHPLSASAFSPLSLSPLRFSLLPCLLACLLAWFPVPTQIAAKMNLDYWPILFLFVLLLGIARLRFADSGSDTMSRGKVFCGHRIGWKATGALFRTSSTMCTVWICMCACVLIQAFLRNALKRIYTTWNMAYIYVGHASLQLVVDCWV